MQYFFITGTSRGLGKALAEKILKDRENVVYGISRSQSIEHENYHHITADFSNPEEADAIDFSIQGNETRAVFLINNAGTLGNVSHLGVQSSSDISQAININVTAPAILMNNFLKKFKPEDYKKVIINISSGAGKSAIDGWSIYCSSKSALDMMSEVVKQEQEIEGAKNFFIYSVAPGIVDTKMQEEIRSADKSEFSNVEKFKEFKMNKELAEPKLVADKFFRNFIDHLPRDEETIQTIRDYV